MEANLWTLIGAIVLLTLSLLSVYRPNLVWGRARPVPDEKSRQRLVRRRKVGTLVYFFVGAILLVLSFH
jgi:accessory gene regulator protein AgrB